MSGIDDTIPASSPPEHAKSPRSETGESPRPAERYRLGAELGRGGMGRVVEAFDTQLGRTVALKEVLPSGGPTVLRRFQREVQITARLEHASIVPLYDAGVMIDGRPYYVMRRVSGQPLDELIARTRGLPDRLALLPNVLAAIDAIAHAHRRGVIHRDLKPQNILVGELGETVVIDWGLAKVLDEDDVDADLETQVPSAADSLQTQLGAVFGTPGFMAPEQARGEVIDPRGDVFALGATLYQLLTGKPPISGTSATEVIASTMRHKIVPVTTACPSAPPELAAIIAKALAAERDDRYANAGELAEDVRSFTTGQLVGAHRYTRLQRLARFVRRHRAALAVAAAASVAVAVLAWFSVSRILHERDTARAARAEAELQRANADGKATELRQRADQLLIAHARALLDASPTAAVATLKQLDPKASPAVVAEAKALAKSAIVRGVAWGVPALRGFTIALELTRDGKRVLQTTRGGELQVVDLDTRRAVATHTVGPHHGALWVDDDRKVLVWGPQPRLVDPVTGASEPIGTDGIVAAAKTARGDVVAYVDSRDRLGLLDVAARTTRTLPTTGRAQHDVAIAADGSYIAYSAQTERLVVVDRNGRELASRAGRVITLAVSPGGKLAASLYEEVVEVSPAAKPPVFTRVDLPAADAHGVHWLAYTGERLQLFGFRHVMTWAHSRLERGEAISDGVYLGSEAGDGVTVATANDNRLHVLAWGKHLALPLTSKPDGVPRLATARGHSRFVATTRDALLVFDLDAIVPRFVTTPGGPFLDAGRILVPSGPTSEWFVLDLETGAKHPLALPFGIPNDYDIAADGRLLVVVAGPEQTVSAVVVYPDLARKVTVDALGSHPARLVPGDGLVYAAAGGKVFGRIGGAAPRELATLDGDIVGLAANGPLGFAALSKTGELVTGKLDGTTVERVRIDITRRALIACDRERSVLVAADNRLLRYKRDVHELARFPADPSGTIVGLDARETGTFVTLASKAVYFIPASGDQTPRRLPVAGGGMVAQNGDLYAGTATSMQIELADVPSLAGWSLPRLYTGMPTVVLSPDGSRVAQQLGGTIALWQLPRAGTDLAAWLDEVTNATAQGDHLAWPWQTP